MNSAKDMKILEEKEYDFQTIAEFYRKAIAHTELYGYICQMDIPLARKLRENLRMRITLLMNTVNCP